MNNFKRFGVSTGTGVKDRSHERRADPGDTYEVGETAPSQAQEVLTSKPIPNLLVDFHAMRVTTRTFQISVPRTNLTRIVAG